VEEEALDATAFALGEFARRADEAGARIVGLIADTAYSERRWTVRERARLERRLSAQAAEAGIPVLSLAEEMRRRGVGAEEMRWPHDAHWSAAAHRLAAEALWRWVEDDPPVCAGG